MANNEIICPKCHGNVTIRNLTYTNKKISVNCSDDVNLRGVMDCEYCKHEFPIVIALGTIQRIDVALPGSQSGKLNLPVPQDILDDIKEAERANYAKCLKASATMCRRALQLGLIEKGIPDGTLSQMLKQANTAHLIDDQTYPLAISIKGLGDIGAHRKESLDEHEIEMLIYATVRMLNELFPAA